MGRCSFVGQNRWRIWKRLIRDWGSYFTSLGNSIEDNMILFGGVVMLFEFLLWILGWSKRVEFL